MGKLKNQISRQSKYSSKILKLANQDPDDQEQIWLIVKLMETHTEKNPFISSKDLKQKTIASAIDNGIDGMMAERFYRAASQVVVPFMNSGEKLLRSDALLDGLINHAKEHLMQPIYDKNGNILAETFSPETMNAIVKAVNVKLQTLTKVQANLINAQRESSANPENKDFELDNADTEQLERFIGGEIKDYPELVEKIFNKTSNKQIIEIKNFHEES